MSIILIDTSVFVEILNIPNMNEQHDHYIDEMKNYIKENCILLLPAATIIETGNHVAQNGNGAQRRDCAEKFIFQVKASFTGEAPWRAINLPLFQNMLDWIDDFPDLAMRNKKPDKNEGISLGDMMIIKEWERICSQNPMSEVMIWSKDIDMKAYCRKI